MKNSLLLLPAIILVFASCEKNDNDVFLKTGSGLEYKFSDMALYDTSSHVLYFKTVHDEFKSIEKGSFTFVDREDPIYTGSFWPGYSSTIPSGPFIMSPPSFMGNYALQIDNWHSDKPDVRIDPRMINILKRNNLFHSGLAISSSFVTITGTHVTFRFTITNKDESDLLIIDPEKTGLDLFHYFTNGLYIYDMLNNEVFSSTIQSQKPDPWNSWKMDWLSELKSGDSKEFTINYTLNNQINAGEYYATFSFPGLAYQVAKDQLWQGTSRIWLGDIKMKKMIIVK